ncbi:hypothetical protein DAPPUDRAFT_107099 [Daphnia pulex]|uniref:Uncharacterized protein n=1 Tax=Daphnia pulex TaxID=6669 RepID=E9GVY1_DAPPU|nr:hypothetical protein DAPPUDRAFT_107099 [Daphnia pulex]|eukprot:EFX76368.1 hypothetical protein DAPPUDRAFT_107099 [Daphnia pulex]
MYFHTSAPRTQKGALGRKRSSAISGVCEEVPPGAGKELDELSAMGAAAVRKREKWKWLLPSWAPATTLSGTHEETFRADDIRLSAGYWSSSSSSWNSRSFTCLLALAFIFQSVSALPPVIRIGTKK